MPLTLIALSEVDDKDAGPASSLVNTGHVVGGSIGLAIAAPDDVGLDKASAVIITTHVDHLAAPLNSHEEPALTRKTAQSAHIH
jgi:hypothetical protein